MVSKRTQSGFALLLSIVVASVLLALGLTMLTITSQQLLLSSVARESEKAFQAATAGKECMMYHRNQNVSNNYSDRVSAPGTAPAVSCFGVTSQGPTGFADAQEFSHHETAGSPPDDYTSHFDYRFSWASGAAARCSEVILFVMVADTDGSGDDYANVDFTNYNDAIGSNGLKTCTAGNTCTILVSRGYNTSCADVDAGLATVQREITLQF